ncbi:glycoside hydrolase/deacetylase, partial [Anaeromyces robustus]
MAVKATRIESCTKPNTIALTFDDGPYQYSEELLDTLKKAGIHATFFINGDNYWGDLTNHKRGRKIIKRMAEDGHQIASHTWNHSIPSTKAGIKESMTKLDNLIESITGKRPKYFRAPKGDCDQKCASSFEELGYKVIQWDTDTNDWDIENTTPSKRVSMAKNFLKNRWGEKKSNYLILMHETYKHTVEELVPWVIKNKPKGYKFVTVAECLGDS